MRPPLKTRVAHQLIRWGFTLLGRPAKTAWYPAGESPEEKYGDLLRTAQTLLRVHADVVMDTPEDKALHARAVDAFARALEYHQGVLNGQAADAGNTQHRGE